MRPYKTFKIDDNEYTITIIDGNHGGWMFVSCNGVTIWEQAGYKDDNLALVDGETIARTHGKELKSRVEHDPLNSHGKGTNND